MNVCCRCHRDIENKETHIISCCPHSQRDIGLSSGWGVYVCPDCLKWLEENFAFKLRSTQFGYTKDNK